MLNYSVTIPQLLRNSCASKPWKNWGKSQVPGSQLFMGTLALCCVSSCVAFCELLRLLPRPLLLRPQYPIQKGIVALVT